MTDNPRFLPLLTLEALQAGLASQVVVAPRDGIYEDLRPTLSQSLADHWREVGIEQLYFHQSEAIQYARHDSVLVSTGTSSGKTACFAAPIYETLLNEPMARALVLYPTKALAQDQSQRFERFAPSEGIRIGVYDGDTPARQRSHIRKTAQVILSNPDMLHVGILPNHENWASFFRNLRFVVLDEVHTYRGIFGLHMQWVITRLKRICKAYGSSPTFLGASATLGNPESFFHWLTKERVRVVSTDTAPQGQKQLWTWVAPEDVQVSPHRLTADVLAASATHGLRAIAFCRSRLGVEVVMKHARETLREQGHDPSWIESYRAGYTPEERREIERAVFSGSTRGLVATSAMELGVDIGNLDVSIINGFPGTLASFRQQAGRAGRSGRDGLALFVAQNDPLDQWLATEPESLLYAKAENLSTPSFNRHVAQAHLQCMAFEKPITGEEIFRLGKPAEELGDEMDAEGLLHLRTGFFYYPSYTSPAAKVDLRTAGGQNYTIHAGERMLGSMEAWRAFQSAYPGAIYLHRGESFEVKRLDLEQYRIEVEQATSDYSTQSLVQNVVTQSAEIEVLPLDAGEVTLGAFAVTSAVHAYERKEFGGGGGGDLFPVDLPAQTMDTVGIAWRIPMADFEDLVAISGIHALEHAFILSAPFIAECDRNDLGSSWMLGSELDARATITIFDRCPGGIGLCEALYAKLSPWVSASLRLLERCSCESGCPRCLLRPGCESANEHLSKIGALRLLEEIRESLDRLDG